MTVAIGARGHGQDVLFGVRDDAAIERREALQHYLTADAKPARTGTNARRRVVECPGDQREDGSPA